MRAARRASWLLLLPILFLGLACAPPREKLGWQGTRRPWFDAEILGGVDGSGLPVATLAVTVSHRNLVFFSEGDGFVARYTIRAVQQDGERALRSQEWSGLVSVDSYEETRGDATERQTVQLRLHADSDKRPTKIVVSLGIAGTQRRSSTILALSPQAVKSGGIELGQISMYRRRNLGSAAPTSPLKLSAQGLPDPLLFERSIAHHFDSSTGTPWLLLRVFDLRDDPQTAHRLNIASYVGDSSEWSDEISVVRDGVETAVLVELPLEALSYGKNELRIALPMGVTRNVTIDNLGIDLSDDSSWTAIVAQVEPIAEDEELSLLRSATAGNRVVEWSNFWRRRDPDPSTAENARLQEHYRRVAYSRIHYEDGYEDGATSDRGRVYVELGEPDAVEEFANRHDMLTTWQLWRYQSHRLVYYFRLDSGSRYRLAWFERS